MRWFTTWMILLLGWLCIAPQAMALERFDIVTTEQLQDMLDQRQAGALDFVLVNALDEIIYRHAAIPGSVNVPWSRVAETGHRLGKDKQRLIVTY